MKNVRRVKISKIALLLLLQLIIYPLLNRTQSAPPAPSGGCGSQTTVLIAGDSLMIAYQPIRGSDNYALSLRKAPDGTWVRPTGDYRSGCSRMGYFVLYFRYNYQESCQKFNFEAGKYSYRVTAYRDTIHCITPGCKADSCTMDGDFYLTDEQIWKGTYSYY